MIDLDKTLPGDIPGLLRRGSPVWWRDEETPYIVCYVWRVCDDDSQGGENVLAAPCTAPCIGLEDCASNFAIDLTEKTGRVHAAWWALTHPNSVKGFNGRDAAVVEAAGAGVDMDDEETAVLKNLVLRLAGRLDLNPKDS